MRCRTAPLGKSGGTGSLETGTAGERVFLVEVVADRGMDGGELLQASHPPEPLHRPLSPSERQVGVLCPVVGPTAGFESIPMVKLLQGRTGGAQPVHDEGLGLAVPLQRLSEEFQRGLAIACLRHKAIQHFPFMVDGSPE